VSRPDGQGEHRLGRLLATGYSVESYQGGMIAEINGKVGSSLRKTHPPCTPEGLILKPQLELLVSNSATEPTRPRSVTWPAASHGPVTTLPS